MDKRLISKLSKKVTLSLVKSIRIPNKNIHKKSTRKIKKIYKKIVKIVKKRKFSLKIT